VLYNGWDLSAEAKEDRKSLMEKLRVGDLLIVRPSCGVGPTIRRELQKTGLMVVAFIPRDAYLVSVMNVRAARGWLRSSKFALRLKPEWKAERSLWRVGTKKRDVKIPPVLYATHLSNDLTTSSCQGTSMASPITAGCTTLIRQYYVEG